MGIANVEHANTLIFHCPAFAPFVGFVPLSAIAILDGRPDTYDEMDAAAKRKATIDTKKIIAEVKTIAKKLDSDKAELVEHIDAVGAKVEKLKVRSKRKSKYSDAMREACLMYWEAAQTNPEVIHSVNTRPTREAAFRYYAKQLAEHGIDSFKKFDAVLHATQNLESARRRKKLDEQRDGTKKKSPLPTQRGNGKMSGVKSFTRNAFALMFALGSIALNAAPAASARISENGYPPPVRFRKAS